MASTENANHSVWTRQGPVVLTDAQERIREDVKAYAAVTLFQGAVWTQARDALARLGLEGRAVDETLTDAVQELIDDGWLSYRP